MWLPQDAALEGQHGRLRLSYAKDRQIDLRGVAPQSSAASDALQASSTAFALWLPMAHLVICPPSISLLGDMTPC